MGVGVVVGAATRDGGAPVPGGVRGARMLVGVASALAVGAALTAVEERSACTVASAPAADGGGRTIASSLAAFAAGDAAGSLAATIANDAAALAWLRVDLDDATIAALVRSASA